MKSRLVLSSLLASAAAFAAGPTPSAATGTLTANQRQYVPQGCVHNGNTAVCTFVLVNQGQLANLLAWGWGNELQGLQFVDNAHVPHGAASAYFVDRFGTRQDRIVLQRGEQGTLQVELPNVDPGVTSGLFTFGNQMVAGIAVGHAAPVNIARPATMPAPAAVPQAPLQAQGLAQAAAMVQPVGVVGVQAVGAVGVQPVVAYDRVSAAGAKVANAAGTVNSTVQVAADTMKAVGQMKDTLKGLFGSRQTAAPAPAASQAQP